MFICIYSMFLIVFLDANGLMVCVTGGLIHPTFMMPLLYWFFMWFSFDLVLRLVLVCLVPVWFGSLCGSRMRWYKEPMLGIMELLFLCHIKSKNIHDRRDKSQTIIGENDLIPFIRESNVLKMLINKIIQKTSTDAQVVDTNTTQ